MGDFFLLLLIERILEEMMIIIIIVTHIAFGWMQLDEELSPFEA